jgi:hypothetical protein
VEQYYAAAISHADELYNDAIGAVNAVEADVQSVAATLTGGLNAAVTGLEADIIGVADKAAAEIATAVTEAEAAAASLASAAAAGLSGAINAGAADVINPSLEALAPAIAVIAPYLTTEGVTIPGLEAIPGVTSVPGIMAGLGVLAPAIAGVATVTAECTVPMCENLGGLSNLLNSATLAALIAAVMALAAEAVHDPAAAHDDILEVENVVSGAVSSFTSLLGVS